MSGGGTNIFKFRELTSETQEIPSDSLIAKIPRSMLRSGILSPSQDPVLAELILANQLPVSDSVLQESMMWAYPVPQIITAEITHIRPSSSPVKQEDRLSVVFEMVFLGFILILS